MSKFSPKSFLRFLERKKSDSNPSPRAGLSVNSLSKVSSQLSSLAEGETIRKISFWLSLLICSSLVADLAVLVVEKYFPSPPISPLASRVGGLLNSNPMNYEIISERNLFSSKQPKKSGDSIDLEAEPVLSTLNYQLIGTVIFHNPARSLAAIQDKSDNKLYPVRAGDQMGDNVQILSVEPRKVIFINTTARRREYIEIPEDPAIKITAAPKIGKTSPAGGGINQVEENKFVISRTEIDSQMANFNVLITQARAVPEMRGGQMIGFKLMQIVPNSFYQKAGFKENDVIKSVNGEKITDAAKALELLQNLKSMPSLDMTIERGGKDIPFNYDIR
jgi:type II secretion system protein C